MVDVLQKLCINHYFQEEIDSILKMVHTRMSNSHDYNHGPSLYEVSLNFRILRQEGYYVSDGEHMHSCYSTFELKLELFISIGGLENVSVSMIFIRLFWFLCSPSPEIADSKKSNLE
ncbi:putative (3S,6E)-nerolidol synthase [Helianthus annuus]|nr:putative (3S,6E)-nerolidol synthase [Helianthus annuus]